MNVTTLVLNAAGQPHFESKDQFDFKALVQIAKDREQHVLEKGAQWAAGAVSFLGSEVVKAVETGEHKDVTKAIIQTLMAAWLFDSLFLKVSLDQYLQSDIKFTIAADGAVSHSRVPAT